MSDDTGHKKTSPGIHPAPRSTFANGGPPAPEPLGSGQPPRAAFGQSQSPQPPASAAPQAAGEDGGKRFKQTMVITPGTVPPPAPPEKRPTDRPPAPVPPTRTRNVAGAASGESAPGQGPDVARAPAAQDGDDGKKSGTRKSPYAQTMLINQSAPLAKDEGEPLREPSDRPPPTPYRAGQAQVPPSSRAGQPRPALPEPTMEAHSHPPPSPPVRTLPPRAPTLEQPARAPQQQPPAGRPEHAAQPPTSRDDSRRAVAQAESQPSGGDLDGFATTQKPAITQATQGSQDGAHGLATTQQAAVAPEQDAPEQTRAPALRLAVGEHARPVGPRARGESFDPESLSLQIREADIGALVRPSTGPMLRAGTASGPPSRLTVPRSRAPMLIGGALVALLLLVIGFFVVRGRGEPEAANEAVEAVAPQRAEAVPAAPQEATAQEEPEAAPDEASAGAVTTDKTAKKPAKKTVKKPTPKAASAAKKVATPPKPKPKPQTATRRVAPAPARPAEESESIRQARSALDGLPVVQIKPKGEAVLKVSPSAADDVSEPDVPEPPAPPPPPPPPPPEP